jgi:hypothetical protein
MKRKLTFGSIAVAALLAISSPVQAADASRLGADLGEVAKLVQSGVDEGVILTFIDKNPLQRNPSADELVYLKTLGLSSKAMVALMSSATAAKPAAVAVQPTPAAPSVQSAPPTAVQPAPVQPTVVTPPVVYAPVAPPTVYVERPYVDYSYPAWSFGLHLGHHLFGHGHWGHYGGHHGGHHGHHGGHYRGH